MKWIGQHIWDFVSRFRNDIYITNKDTGNEHKITTSTNAVDVVVPSGTGSVGGVRLLNTYQDDPVFNFVVGRAFLDIKDDLGTGNPGMRLQTGANGAYGTNLTFTKARLSGGSIRAGDADDIINTIHYKSYNDAGTPEQITFAQVEATIADASDTDESGKYEIKVATSDGSTSAVQNALKAQGSPSDNDVDVTIGHGSTSNVTAAGNVKVINRLTAQNEFNLGGHTVNDIDITSEFVDSDEHLMTSKAINARIAAAGGGVSVADSNTDTAFPVVFHDESNNLLDDTSGFLYNPNTGTVTIPSSLTMDGGLWSYSSGQVTMASTSSDLPVIALVNTNTNATPPVLAFQKTDTGSDDDALGSIKFTGDDDGGAVTNYCQILGEIKESANGAEEGRLVIRVIGSTGAQDVIVATGLSGASIPKRHFAIPADGAGNHDGDIVYIGTNTGGTATVAGQIYYYASTGLWVLTNSDDPSTATGWLAVALGADPDVDGMLVRGMVDLQTNIVGTEALGSILYLDKATPGAATTAAPTATGDIVRVIGYAVSTGDANKIWFSPDNTWVEHV